VDYIISVFVFTLFIYGLYVAWLRLPLDQHADETARGAGADGVRPPT
jgi:hypothetical protein